RFVNAQPIYDLRLMNMLFRSGKNIPIDSQERNPEAYQNAFRRIRDELAEGELVCLFPEGQLTRDGELAEFKSGMEKIVKETPVPVIPLALSGLWGSFFSHHGGPALRRLPPRFWSRVTLRAGEPVPAQAVRRDYMRR